MKTLLRIDRNGTEYHKIDCPKCGGSGSIYGYGHVEGGRCFKCDGSGKTTKKVYTPEHRAKLDANNEKRRKERLAKIERNREEGLNRWRKENPEKVKAYEEKQHQQEEEKQLQEFIGQVKERIEIVVELVKTISFETQWGTSYLHIMKDEEKNMFVWKTSGWIKTKDGIEINREEKAKIIGTVKEHTTYNGNKQTVLTRVKVIEKLSALKGGE